jgi:hypothetical protein
MTDKTNTSERETKWGNIEERLKKNPEISILDKHITWGDENAGWTKVARGHHWMTFLVAPNEPRYTIPDMESTREDLANYLGIELKDWYFKIGMPWTTRGLQRK